MIVGAWLATDEANAALEQAAYTNYSQIITHVYPTHAGKWDADGNLVQEEGKLTTAWALALPGLASDYGHVYAPSVSCSDPAGLMENDAVWEAAINELLDVAATRFDAPWDAVMFDIEATPSEYREELNTFFALAKEALQGVGLPMFGWFWNCLLPHDECVMCDNATDWNAYGSIFDRVHVGESFRTDGVSTPQLELCIAPIWWVEEGLQRMIDEGVPAEKIVIDLRLSGRYCTGPNPGDTILISYSTAMGIIEDAGAELEWLDHFPAGAFHPESMEPGSVQEWMADLPDDKRMWIEDYRTTAVRLQFATKYGITNCAVFRPATSNPTSWDAIADWKQPDILRGCLNAYPDWLHKYGPQNMVQAVPRVWQ